MTSNKKISKKARQYYRRTMRDEARELGRTIGNAMKPKPAWMPWKVWMFLVKLVIRTK
jgi:hypothetical protein